ncbi:MAG TPA: diguanylate cyclase [Trichocoleus sp.]
MASVLIVEDEPIAAWNIRETLEELGHQIIDEVASGQGAIDTARSARPDLVLMDIRLPGDIDGIEAAEAIQNQLSIPVIFLTAYADERTVQRAIATSPFGYLVKPFRGPDLRASIEIALRRHRQERALGYAETHLENALECLGDSVVTTDIQGRVTFINSEAETLSGWSRQAALGQPIERVIRLVDQSDQLLTPHPLHQALQQASAIVDQTWWLQTRQGQILPVNGSASSIQDHSPDQACADPGELLGGVLVFHDATERQQLEEQLRQQAERGGILNALAFAVRQSLDLEEILATTTEQMQQLLQVNRVVVYRLEPDGSGMVIAESLAGDYLSMQGVVLLDPCLTVFPCLERYQNGQSQVLADLQAAELAPCYLALLAPFEVKAHIVVPLLVSQHQLWGLLAVQHCAAPRLWQSWEVELTQQLALQVGMAIQQSQLYDQSRQQARQQTLLNELVQTIRTSLNLDEVLHLAAQSLLSSFQVSRSVVRLGRQHDDTFVYCMSLEAPGVEPLRDQAMPIAGNPLVQALFERPEAIAVADVAQAEWLKPLQPFFRRAQVRAFLCVAIRFEGRVRGLLCLHQCDRTRIWSQDEQQLIAKVADQLAISIQQAELYRRLHRANQELNRLAHLDGLTQIANRRFFDEYLDTEYRRQQRQGTPLALILCDVDHFKRFNDTYGHPVGDDCLKAIAQAIAGVLKRPGDLLARFGGEEFAVVLPDTDLPGALTLGEDILTVVRQLRLPVAGLSTPAQVTISMGIVSLDTLSVDSPAALVQAADRALYQAKAQGRDGYCVLP